MKFRNRIQFELVLNFWILIMLRFALRALSLILCRKGSYLENFEIIIFLIMLEKILFRLLLFLIEFWPKRRFQVHLLDFLQWLYQTLTNLQSSKKLCFVDKILFSIVLSENYYALLLSLAFERADIITCFSFYNQPSCLKSNIKNGIKV